MSHKSCSTCEHTERKWGNSFVYMNQSPDHKNPCLLKDELKEIGEKHNWDPYIMPEVCGRYEPRMVKNFSNCGKEINKPEHEWHLFASPTMDPVCSEDCRAKKEGGLIGNWFM